MFAYEYTTLEWVCRHKIDNIENKANSFNQSEDSKYTKFIYKNIMLSIKLSSP